MHLHAHLRMITALFSLHSGSPDVWIYKQKVSHYSAPGKSPCSLRTAEFVCIEMLINFSYGLHSDHRDFVLDECISLGFIQTAKVYLLRTNNRLNVLIGHPQTILYLEREGDAINHMRVSRFRQCHGQLKKKTHSVCKMFEELIMLLLFKATSSM